MMRSAIRTAAVLLLFLATADASAQMRVALTGGLDFAALDQSSHSSESTTHDSGFSTGVSAIHSLFGPVELELHSVYSRRGRSYPYADWPAWPTRDRGVRGVEQTSEEHLGLVALGRVNLPQAARGLHAHLAAGPAVSWETSCRVTTTIQESTLPWIVPTATWTEECNTAQDRMNFGLAAGLGFEFRLTGDMGVTLGTLYTHGFRNLAKRQDHRLFGANKKLRAITIRTGIVYGIG